MAKKKLTRTLTDADGKAHQYAIIQFGAEDGFDFFCECWAIAAPSIGQLTGAVSGAFLKGSSASVDGELLGKALGGIAPRILKGGGTALAKRLLEFVTRDDINAATNFGTFYQGNYGELMGAIRFSVEVNWSSFFDGLSEIKELKAALASFRRKSAGALEKSLKVAATS